MMSLAAYDFLYQIAIFGGILIVTFIFSSLLGIVIRRLFKGWIPVIRSHVQRFVTIVVWIGGGMLAVQQLA